MQNDKRRASYFTFILLLAIATLIGSWGSFYFFTQKLERDSSESYNEKQFEHVQGISRNINDIFLIIERELETVASSAEVRSGNGRDALPILATSYRKLENHVSDIAVIDSQGRFLATHKTGLKRTGISALNRNSTSETIRTKAPSLAGPFLTLVQSKAISLDVPVFRYESVESSESGRTVTGKVFVGTVSCLVEVDKWIENYLKPFDAQINSSTWIINNNSQVVANTNSALIGEKWLDIEDGSFKDPTPGIPDRSGDLQFLNTVLGGKSGKFQGKLGSLGTEDQIVAYAPINITNTRWS
ncbi:MAG: cache domain-containing protein, partial [Blastocatellia bacterium]|nr:cache domain-containing protein [Blastocatellia bacterium]